MFTLAFCHRNELSTLNTAWADSCGNAVNVKERRQIFADQKLCGTVAAKGIAKKSVTVEVVLNVNVAITIAFVTSTNQIKEI